ncbi:hypothetical protein NDA07_21835 [Microcoleus vaginatus DQ-U2]|uniref:hypothetical protein n=1 Tax=Microcoleus vaginatus TaxID=119532 RepID=UPI0016870C06|nr:hypothetical protein [Microcoleus sp. FACHB-DQ6]
MSGNKTLTKEQILKAIEELEKNPDDKLGILGDVGITALGAIGAGVAVSAAGVTTSIPIITAITGIGMVVAAPLGLVAGAALAGGAACYGVSRLIKGGGYNEAKKKELIQQLNEQLREVETKERASKLGESDKKTKFIVSLKEPVRLNLITPQDAQHLMRAVETGQMPIKEAINMVKAIVEAAQPQ